jgi:beta-lactam-binding protein with PASTA domain
VGVPIPDVVGLSALQAIQVLQSFGLSVTSAEPTPGSPGVVVATDPAAAAMVVPGTPVTLFVGTTPERVDPGD